MYIYRRAKGIHDCIITCIYTGLNYYYTSTSLIQINTDFFFWTIENKAGKNWWRANLWIISTNSLWELILINILISNFKLIKRKVSPNIPQHVPKLAKISVKMWHTLNAILYIYAGDLDTHTGDGEIQSVVERLPDNLGQLACDTYGKCLSVGAIVVSLGEVQL